RQLDWPTPLVAAAAPAKLDVPKWPEPPATKGHDEVITVPLSELAHARSGDKGDTANIGVVARAPEIYPWLVATLSAKRVKQHFAGICHGEVERHEVPNLWALNFLLGESLGGGGTVSLRLDAQGKTLSHALLAMPVRASRALIACAQRGDDEHRALLGLKPRLERVDGAAARPASPAPARRPAAAKPTPGAKARKAPRA